MENLKEAKVAAYTGAGYVEEGEVKAAHVMLHLAEARAQIAQAEALNRIADLMDGTTDAPGMIGVTGHVTTGAP